MTTSLLERLRFVDPEGDTRRIGWGLAALGIMLVSLDSLWVRASGASGWQVSFWVAAFSLPLYTVLGFASRSRSADLGPKNTWTRKLVVMMAITAALSSVSLTSFIIAVTRSSIANVVAVVASAPVMAAAIGWLFLRERTSRRVAIAIGLTVVGVLVVVGGSLGTPNLVGDLLALLAVLCFAITMSMWRRFPEMSTYAVLFTSSLLILIGSSVMVDGFSIGFKPMLAVAAMGITNPLGRLSHSSAPRFAPVAEVALFTPIETVAGTMWAWIFFSERPLLITAVGAAIIMTGVFYGTIARGATA